MQILLKFKVLPSLDQKYDDTSPRKHDICDFETSLRFRIRHDSDKEWEWCTSNKNTLFKLFFSFQFCNGTLSSSFDFHNSFKRKKASHRKRKHCSWHPSKHTTGKELKMRERASLLPVFTCYKLSYKVVTGGHTVLPPANHLINLLCVCVFLSLSLSWLFLTLFFASLSAPASNKSCAITMWPLLKAYMSPVLPYTYT